jgi:hypothetical protein
MSVSSLTDASSSGDRLATLQELRDLLARELEAIATPPAAKAAMARQMVLILAEIERLAPPEQKGTPLDQLEQRRRARGAKTAGVESADGATGPG